MLPEDSMPRHPKMHMKDLVRHLALNETGNMSAYIDCCPTDEEMTEPEGGRNREGMFVELYRDGENVQRFYEYSCKPGVENKPCRFADYRIKAQSRCVQKYSYSYAIVQNPEFKVKNFPLENNKMKFKNIQGFLIHFFFFFFLFAGAPQAS